MSQREAFFGSRRLKVAKMDGQASAKKRETTRKRSDGAVDDHKWSKIVRQKNAIFAPSEQTGGLTETKKQASLTSF